MKRRIVKIVLGVLFFSGVSFISFDLFLHKYTDKYFYNKVEAKMNELIENKYTMSVREDATEKDASSLNRYIGFIYSNDLRAKATQEEEDIIEQILLQVDSKKKIESIKGNKNFKDVQNNKGDILELISSSKKIKNSNLSNTIFKDSQELLSKIEKNEQIKDSINELFMKIDNLKLDDISAFYSIKNLPSLIDFEDLKNDMESKIKELEVKVTEMQKNANITEQNRIKSELDKERNKKEVFEFEKTNSEYKQISALEFRIREIFKESNATQILAFGLRKVYLYEKDEEKSVGFRKIAEIDGKNHLTSRLKLDKKNITKNIEKQQDMLFLKGYPLLTKDSSVSSAFIIEDENAFNNLLRNIKLEEVGVIEE